MALQNNTPDLSTDIHAGQAEASATPRLSLERKLAGISVATLLLGGAAWTLSSSTTAQAEIVGKPTSGSPTTPLDSIAITPTDSVAVEPGLSVAIQPNTDVPVTGGTLHIDNAPIAQDVTNAMSFEQAFETARHEVGMGGVFAWHNKVYNTFTKAEWSDLSLQQRQEFLDDVGFASVAHVDHTPHSSTPKIEPITVEGTINGQRVIGLDFDNNGVIDTLVIQGADGYNYHVVDANGDEGLDTVYKYDSLTQETTMTQKLDKPYILGNDRLQQNIEDSMAAEVLAQTVGTESAADPDQTSQNETTTQNDVTDPEDPEASYDKSVDEEPDFVDEATFDDEAGYINNAPMEDYND